MFCPCLNAFARVLSLMFVSCFLEMHLTSQAKTQAKSVLHSSVLSFQDRVLDCCGEFASCEEDTDKPEVTRSKFCPCLMRIDRVLSVMRPTSSFDVRFGLFLLIPLGHRQLT